MELVVHNGQLRTNSCENGRLVTLQVNHLISDNLLSQFLCCDARGEDCVCQSLQELVIINLQHTA